MAKLPKKLFFKKNVSQDSCHPEFYLFFVPSNISKLILIQKLEIVEKMYSSLCWNELDILDLEVTLYFKVSVLQCNYAFKY